MPPKTKKSVLLTVTNIGATSLEQNSLEDEPFIDKAKYAMRILIEKKIFLQPKDEIGIITMGDNETDNPEGMDNVKLYCDHPLVPNWEMVKYVNNLTSTNKPSHWIEALHVALQFIKREVMDPAFCVFIVIFNNFREEADTIEQFDASVIIEDIKNCENLCVIFVGENPLNEPSYKRRASPSEKFVLKVVGQAAAQYEQIESFIEQRRFYQPPPTNSMAWKANLECAGLNIPCASYKKVDFTTETNRLDKWQRRVIKESQDFSSNSATPLPSTSKDSVGPSGLPGTSNNPADTSGLADTSKSISTTNVVKENLKIDLHRNEIQPENMINGYKFGGKYIPCDAETELPMKYTGSTKSLIVYGFVPQDEVKMEYWAGQGSRIFVPQSPDDAEAFYSFVQAMVDKKYAAIVRKVVNNNTLPKMGVLFPRVDENSIWCLVHLELPYIHDVRTIKKKPIKSLDKIVDKEKLDAVGDFIDAMTVNDDEPHYLSPGLFPNVHDQYNWNAISHRIVNPDSPLLPLNDYINKYLIPAEDLNIKAKPHIEKLSQLFASTKSTKDSDNKPKSVNGIPKADDITSDVTSNSNKDPSNNNNGTNDSFFAPEDVDVKMDELEDM